LNLTNSLGYLLFYTGFIYLLGAFIYLYYSLKLLQKDRGDNRDIS